MNKGALILDTRFWMLADNYESEFLIQYRESSIQHQLQITRQRSKSLKLTNRNSTMIMRSV